LKKNIVKIDEEKCKACGLCIIECPQKIIGYSGKINSHGYDTVKVTDTTKCSGCSFCAISCPDGVIEICREEE